LERRERDEASSLTGEGGCLNLAFKELKHPVRGKAGSNRTELRLQNVGVGPQAVQAENAHG